jgi:hypothetical protein
MEISNRFDVKLTLYYRVNGSELYGGEGSIGYAKQSFDHCYGPKAADDAAAEGFRKSMADMLGVPAENLEFISWSEYQAIMGDDEDDAWADDDWAEDD